MQHILSDLKKGVLLSGEVYKLLNKLLKFEEENSSGDSQLLCELFSGEKTSYRFVTKKVRKIEENTPFNIIGSMQLLFAARIIGRMDQGHGLIERMTIITHILLEAIS